MRKLKSQKKKKIVNAFVCGDEITGEFSELLRIVFAFYDKDKDGFWNDKELSNFLLQVNQQEAPKDFKDDMMKKYGSQNDSLTIEGLMSCYAHNADFQSEEDFWNDIKNLGFSEDFEPVDNRYKDIIKTLNSNKKRKRKQKEYVTLQ